jgi:hypothetical protein
VHLQAFSKFALYLCAAFVCAWAPFYVTFFVTFRAYMTS